MGNDLDPDQFDASLNFKSVANDLDPDRFDASPDPREIIWIRINLMRVQICGK